MKVPFEKENIEAVMEAVGPIVPMLLREAIEEGFYRYKTSRSLDPLGFPDYGPISKANMLYDRIAAASRELIDTLSADLPAIQYTIHSNTKSTEILFDPYFAFRVKRTKSNRHGMPTSYPTWRQRRINSPTWEIRQLRIPFPGGAPIIETEDRLWLTAGFDLDDVEERIEKTVIGVTTRRHWLWRYPLDLADAEIVASFPSLLADRMNEMRAARSA
jgi:hypothetical protein